MSIYPTELVAKSEFELRIFERVSQETGKQLLDEVKRLREALNQPAAPEPVAWVDAAERVPLESDGEVFVRFTDGSIGTAWATYWHGASNAFAQWTHPDPDEDRTIAHWMKAPELAASPAQKGGE